MRNNSQKHHIFVIEMLIEISKELEQLTGWNSLPEGLENLIVYRKFLNSPIRKKSDALFGRL
jgi:hypothetical protein